MAKGKIVMTGYQKILEDIENIEENAPKVLKQALEITARETNEQYKEFINKHHYSGITEDSIESKPKVENEGDKLTVQTGFNLNKGGIASIYLDKGTPKMKPYHFMKNIKNTNIVRKVFREKLKEIVRG